MKLWRMRKRDGGKIRPLVATVATLPPLCPITYWPIAVELAQSLALRPGILLSLFCLQTMWWPGQPLLNPPPKRFLSSSPLASLHRQHNDNVPFRANPFQPSDQWQPATKPGHRSWDQVICQQRILSISFFYKAYQQRRTIRNLVHLSRSLLLSSYPGT